MAVDTSNWTPEALASYQKTEEQTRDWAPAARQRALDTAAKTATDVSARSRQSQSTSLSNLQALREDYIKRGWNTADVDRKIAEASGTRTTALPKMGLPSQLPKPKDTAAQAVATQTQVAPQTQVVQPAQPPAAQTTPEMQPTKVSITTRAPTSLPDRTRELQVMQARLEREAKAIEKDIKSAEGELEGIPDGIKKSYEKDFADLKANQKDLISSYERVQKANLDEFSRNKLYAQFAGIAETLAFSVLRYHAGLQGMKTGRDVSTGLEFRPTNWAQEVAGLRDELQIKNQQAKQLLDEKLGPVKEAEAAKRKTMEEEMHSRLMSARERLQALRGEKVGKEKEAVGLAETKATLQTRADEAAERFGMALELAGIKAEKAKSDSQAKLSKDMRAQVDKDIEAFGQAADKLTNPKKDVLKDAHAEIRRKLKSVGMADEEIEKKMEEMSKYEKGFFGRLTSSSTGQFAPESIKLIWNEYSARRHKMAQEAADKLDVAPAAEAPAPATSPASAPAMDRKAKEAAAAALLKQ